MKFEIAGRIKGMNLQEALDEGLMEQSGGETYLLYDSICLEPPRYQPHPDPHDLNKWTVTFKKDGKVVATWPRLLLAGETLYILGLEGRAKVNL
jgi:hypothetical protein